MGDVDTARLPDLVVDGEDRACGELLLRLALRLRGQPVGALIRLIATDPVAAIDLPYWCHLTGNRFLGAGHGAAGRPHYDIEVRRVLTLAPHHSQPSGPPPREFQSTDDGPGSSRRVANPARGTPLP
jgi:tRNA 2-thiouridine synthesizing protein A